VKQEGTCIKNCQFIFSKFKRFFSITALIFITVLKNEICIKYLKWRNFKAEIILHNGNSLEISYKFLSSIISY